MLRRSSGTYGYAWHATSRDVNKEHNTVIDRATILCRIDVGSQGDAIDAGHTEGFVTLGSSDVVAMVEPVDPIE